MSLGIDLSRAFAKLVAKIDQLALRLRSVEYTVRAQQVREAQKSNNDNAFPAIPGSPALLGGPMGMLVRVKSVQDDYLVCRAWDGVTEGVSDLLVAKPYLLRRTPFHGKTVNGLTYSFVSATQVSVTSGTTTETWVITRPYSENDLLFVAPAGSTGVNYGTVAVTLFDLNADGRAWAQQG